MNAIAQTAVRERPILFTGEMVCAILEGRKTQTRRLVDFSYRWHDERGEYSHEGWTLTHCGLDEPRQQIGAQFDKPKVSHYVLCRYGQPGDRLWVKETFHSHPSHSGPASYRATWDDDDPDGGWKPSIFMPRWASRITLEITAIRVERLQDISEADAATEGCLENLDCLDRVSMSPRDNYRLLWDSINGKAHPWQSNPWVWVISFRVLDAES